MKTMGGLARIIDGTTSRDRKDGCATERTIVDCGLRNADWKFAEKLEETGKLVAKPGSKKQFHWFHWFCYLDWLLLSSAFPVPNSAFRVTQYPVYNCTSLNLKSKISTRSQSRWGVIHELSGLKLFLILDSKRTAPYFHAALGTYVQSGSSSR